MPTPLQEKVGSLLSIKSLREELGASHEAVDRWVKIFENLYYCFLLTPYGAKRINALKKDRKLFMWDWSLCKTPGARFENLVASNLLKYCHFIEDTQDDNEARSVRFKVSGEIRTCFATNLCDKLGDNILFPRWSAGKEIRIVSKIRRDSEDEI